MESKTLPRTIAVVLINGDTATQGVVKKIALGDFAKLAGMIEDLMVSGVKIGDVSSEEGTRALIETLKTAPEKIADVVALISTFTKEEIMRADIESILEVLAQAWKLNNLVKMFSGALKKAMGAQDAPATQETPELGLTEQSPD